MAAQLLNVAAAEVVHCLFLLLRATCACLGRHTTSCRPAPLLPCNNLTLLSGQYRCSRTAVHVDGNTRGRVCMWRWQCTENLMQ